MFVKKKIQYYHSQFFFLKVFAFSTFSAVIISGLDGKPHRDRAVSYYYCYLPDFS